MREPEDAYSKMLGLEDRYQECPKCGGDILIAGPTLICECGYQKETPAEDRTEENW